MPDDVRLPNGSPVAPEPHTSDRYRIMRRGSRYNILGPHGRIFTKYQSASKAGPRWEELTRTPWPYKSTAYERGHRLWELGLIARDQVGKRHIVMLQPKPDPQPAQHPTRVGRSTSTPRPVIIQLLGTQRALPAPKIDLVKQEGAMQALRRNPRLLFTPVIQQALRQEVEYHRPQARWAAHLLKLLARYEQRQRKPSSQTTDEVLTAKHVEWQAGRMSAAAV